jgi:hypothetical protein
LWTDGLDFAWRRPGVRVPSGPPKKLLQIPEKIVTAPSALPSPSVGSTNADVLPSGLARCDDEDIVVLEDRSVEVWPCPEGCRVVEGRPVGHVLVEHDVPDVMLLQ